MPRSHRLFFIGFILLLLIGGPLAYSSYSQAQIRNFRVVREGVLYRSGQLSQKGLKRLIHDYGIRTVITLRDVNPKREGLPDTDEEAYCLKEEINYYRIPPREWNADIGPPPADESVKKFLAVVSDPANQPVLVHCYRGVHRTGAICAIFRMEFDRWTNAEAIAEMKELGYRNLDDEWDVLGYIEQYRPSWKK